jgi:hypothetical protein
MSDVGVCWVLHVAAHPFFAERRVQQTIMTTAAVRGFRIGFSWTLLAWASLNALSYFVWSRGWGNLLGTHPGAAEAVGFPWIIWTQDTHLCHIPALLGDTALGLLAAATAGLATAWVANKIGWVGNEPSPIAAARLCPKRQWQFSLRALFVVTTIVAIVLAIARMTTTARPVLLALIYLLGPLLIVTVSFCLRHIAPRQRGMVVVVSILLLVLAAAILGQAIGTIGDFTKGVFGTFVFWVPQCSVFALLTAVYQWVHCAGGD